MPHREAKETQHGQLSHTQSSPSGRTPCLVTLLHSVHASAYQSVQTRFLCIFRSSTAETPKRDFEDINLLCLCLSLVTGMSATTLGWGQGGTALCPSDSTDSESPVFRLVMQGE